MSTDGHSGAGRQCLAAGRHNVERPRWLPNSLRHIATIARLPRSPKTTFRPSCQPALYRVHSPSPVLQYVTAPVASIAAWRQGSQGRPSEITALGATWWPPTVRCSKMRPHLEVDADSLPERPTLPDAPRQPRCVQTTRLFRPMAPEVPERPSALAQGFRLLSLPSGACSDTHTLRRTPSKPDSTLGYASNQGSVQVVGKLLGRWELPRRLKGESCPLSHG